MSDLKFLRAQFESAGTRLHGWGEADYKLNEGSENYSYNEQRLAFSIWCDALGYNAYGSPNTVDAEIQLPRWIDDLKGRDPLIDDLIGYIITQGIKIQAKTIGPTQVLVPKWAGQFETRQAWINKGRTHLASPDYRKAICVDSLGRRVSLGGDFSRAEEEGTFPVRYFWECELVNIDASGSDRESDSDKIISALLHESMLAEALKPFAEIANLFDDDRRTKHMPNSGTILGWQRIEGEFEITVEHLRAARAALVGTSASAPTEREANQNHATPSSSNEAPTVGWLVDPGAGSACDKLTRSEPSDSLIADVARRSGSISELIARNVSAPDSPPAVAWLVDPGAGSTGPKLTRDKPTETMIAYANSRGGSVTDLIKRNSSTSIDPSQ